MAIDVYLQQKIGAPRRDGNDEYLGPIDDNAYHALAAFFGNLRRRTGQNVDLYGDAAFGGANLDALKTALDEAKTWLDAQPASWEISLGFRIVPQHEEIVVSVQRAALQRLLATLENATERAQLQNGVVSFWGD